MYHMPRGEHLRRIPPEERARRLGQEPLAPGEASELVQVRGPVETLDQFRSLTAKERGEVVQLGLWARKMPTWVRKLLRWIWR